LKLSLTVAKRVLKKLKFRGGFVVAVVRDFETREVLMVAMQNEEAVLKTLTTGMMHYWSRSRQKLWLKGEQSGNLQRVREVRVDCDGDALLFDVDQVGAACHKGYWSCFYRKLKKGKFVAVLKRMFDPKKVYR